MIHFVLYLMQNSGSRQAALNTMWEAQSTRWRSNPPVLYLQSWRRIPWERGGVKGGGPPKRRSVPSEKREGFTSLLTRGGAESTDQSASSRNAPIRGGEVQGGSQETEQMTLDEAERGEDDGEDEKRKRGPGRGVCVCLCVCV